MPFIVALAKRSPFCLGVHDQTGGIYWNAVQQLLIGHVAEAQIVGLVLHQDERHVGVGFHPRANHLCGLFHGDVLFSQIAVQMGTANGSMEHHGGTQKQEQHQPKIFPHNHKIQLVKVR